MSISTRALHLGVLTSLAFVPLTHAAVGASQSDAALSTADSLVTSWVAAEKVAGAVLLVSKDGDTVLEKAYGWAHLNDFGGGQYPPAGRAEAPLGGPRRLIDPVPTTLETAFDLASVTKVMATTLALMSLVDLNRLELDEPLHNYLVDFGGGGRDQITPRHLLTHRAGLQQWQPVYYDATSAEEAYEYIRDLPLAWTPGSARRYSDRGFMLLGRLVEKVAREPLDAFVRERFYGPLGLSATGFRTEPIPGLGPFAATSHGNPYERRMVHDPEFGYRFAGNPAAWSGWRRRTLVGEVNDGNAFHAFGGVAGHAGLFSTAKELQVLLQLLLNRGAYDGRRYIGAEVVDTFLTSTGEGQALGSQVPEYAPPTSFAHSGFTGTLVLGVRDEGLAVILLTNRQNVGVNELGEYVDLTPLQRGLIEALTAKAP